MAVKTVTQAEFARLKGATAAAVGNAIKREQLKKCIRKTKTGQRLALDEAHTEWDARPIGRGRKPVLPAPTAPSLPSKVAGDVETQALDPIQALNDSRAKREHFAALREEMEHRRLEGQLVEASDVRKKWLGIIALTRSKILAIPSKTKSRISDMTLDQVAILDAIVRETLEELADGIPNED